MGYNGASMVTASCPAFLIGAHSGIYASSVKNRHSVLNSTLEQMSNFGLSGCCAAPGNRPFTLKPTLGSLPLRAL